MQNVRRFYQFDAALASARAFLSSIDRIHAKRRDHHALHRWRD
jgi:hypothetical protein